MNKQIVKHNTKEYMYMYVLEAVCKLMHVA